MSTSDGKGVGGDNGGTDDDVGEFEGVDALEVRDALLVEFKAAGLTDAATALRLGCSTKTVQRRRSKPVVRAALAARKADRVFQVSTLLGEAAVDAIAVMHAELRSESAGSRLHAANMILTAFLRTRGESSTKAEVQELSDQFAELKATVHGRLSQR